MIGSTHNWWNGGFHSILQKQASKQAKGAGRHSRIVRRRRASRAFAPETAGPSARAYRVLRCLSAPTRATPTPSSPPPTISSDTSLLLHFGSHFGSHSCLHSCWHSCLRFCCRLCLCRLFRCSFRAHLAKEAAAAEGMIQIGMADVAAALAAAAAASLGHSL